jgi:hypothetical protein
MCAEAALEEHNSPTLGWVIAFFAAAAGVLFAGGLFAGLVSGRLP